MITHERFTYLVQTYIDTVYRIALNYTKKPADAEDITQNVFLKLCQEKKPFQSDEHIRNWLIRVAINECKTWISAPWLNTVSFEEYAATLPVKAQQNSDILRAVMDLPRKYRVPIYLYYYEQYSTQEIADILKIPKGTVCTYLDRGRKYLKLQLQEDDEYA